ncbi:calcium/proton exchanger [Tanacetum coccineum]|uniref:Calcium/proton exchanger n=1 Tax=Tanacetum coccineum TaxID=301880 RepID=A0ABQ5H9X3_9ASTR
MVDLYVEHYGYDVIDFLNYENVAQQFSDSSDDEYSSVDGEDLGNVDFYTTGEEDVIIKNLTTHDDFLNRLCSTGGLFRGGVPKPGSSLPNILEDDPDGSTIEPQFKVKRGIVYPVFNPDIPWNQFLGGSKVGLKRKVRKNKKVTFKEKKDKESGVGSSKPPVCSPHSSPGKKWTKKAIKEDKKPYCPFRLYASWMSSENAFQIKSLISDHKCSRNYNLGSLVNYRWMACQCADQIIKDPFIPLRTMKKDVRQKFMIDVSLGQCKRAKQTALYDHEGGLIDHYGKLWESRQALIDSNPGTTCKLGVEDTSSGKAFFKRMYICFKEVKDGWLAGCRKFKRLFWGATTSTLAQQFEQMMAQLRLLDESAYDYLIERNPNSWSRAFFEMDRRCDAFENDISESFNRAILLPRHKPIITMLEEIRIYVMQRLVAMNKLALNLEDTITPSIRKQLEILKVKQSGFQELEVRKGDESYGVDLMNKVCGCGMWELSGVPCVHAMAGYMHLNKDSYNGKDVWNATKKESSQQQKKALKQPVRPACASRGSGRGCRGDRMGIGNETINVNEEAEAGVGRGTTVGKGRGRGRRGGGRGRGRKSTGVFLETPAAGYSGGPLTDERV